MNPTRRTQAALAVLAVAIIGCSQPSGGGTGGAGPTTTTASPTSATTSVEPLVTSQPGAASPVELATAFVEAYRSFDADGAASYLTDDALQEFAGDVEGLRLQVRHLEAAGWKLLLDSCKEQDSSPQGTSVRCTYDYHGIRSDEVGLGPYSGSQFNIGVLGREIVSVSDNIVFLENGFSDQMWEPFAEFVAETYPDDGAIMYENWPNIFMTQVTDESIELWERHSREYVATQREVAVPQLPVEFTGRIVCGPPVSAARAGDSETLEVGDEGMVLNRYRDGAWRQSVTMTDPRLEGTVYQTWESDTYAMQGAEEGTGVWAATRRIENEQGAWVTLGIGGTFVDGTDIGDPSLVYVGEGAYEGLVAIMEEILDDEGCAAEVRGVIFDGAPVPHPYIPQ